ncbi:DUF2624 family protein [Bacillus sp. N9]
MQLIKNMVNMKVNSITAEDLLKYSGQFNIKVTKSEAEKSLRTYVEKLRYFQ